ncbi:MAG: hypothetical protein ACREOI_00445 [bacterium]
MVERSRRKTKGENDETGGRIGLHIFKSVPDILAHTVAMVLSIGSIWLIHWVLELLLGKNAKFFDLIPIRYVIDAGDLVVILKFFWEVIKGFSGGTKK